MRTLVGASLLGFVALLVSDAHAYQLKETRSGELVRWEQGSIELKMSPEMLERFEGQGIEAAKVATEAWSGRNGAPSVKVTVGGSMAPGDEPTNGIYLMDPWMNDEDQLAVTRTVTTADGTIVGVDIFVNGEKPFAFLKEGSSPHFYDLGAVLSHEIGHVLGLDEALGEPGSIMYPEIKRGEVHQRYPSEDDLAGLEVLYQRSSEPAVGAACSIALARGQGGDSLWIGVIVLVLCAAALVRQRTWGPNVLDESSSVGAKNRVRAMSSGGISPVFESHGRSASWHDDCYSPEKEG